MLSDQDPKYDPSDKHPVYYLFNKIKEYQDILNSLHIHDDTYYKDQESQMLERSIDRYFKTKEMKVLLSAKRKEFEDNFKKEKQTNSGINFEEETNKRMTKYKDDFFELEKNKQIKLEFVAEIQKKIEEQMKPADAKREAKTKRELNEIKDQLKAFLEDKDLFSYCSREVLASSKEKMNHEKMRSDALKIINQILEQNITGIVLPEELALTAKEYGEHFKIEEFQKLLPFIKIGILFEESTDLEAVAGYTFNLIVTFGDARSAMDYIKASQNEQKLQIKQGLKKNSLYPFVYKACQFSPLPPPSEDQSADYSSKAFEAWRKLVKQKAVDGIYMLDNNFKNALGNAPAITKELKRVKKPETKDKKESDENKNRLENKIKFLKEGCDIYTLKITNKAELEPHKKSIVNRKKILLTENGGKYFLHFSIGEPTEAKMVSVALDKEIVEGLQFGDKEKKFKRSKKNTEKYNVFDSLILSNAGYPSAEGYDSMIARQSDFEGRENQYITLEEEIKKIRLELAKNYYYGVSLEESSLSHIAAFNVLSLSKVENKNDRYLAGKGIAEKWRRDFFNLDRQQAGKYIPNIIIDCADIDPTYAGFYLTKVPVQKIDEATKAAAYGKETGCCQSFSGEAGWTCVKHGLTSPYGGFYIIRKGDVKNPQADDPLIHQSWAWRDDKNTGICLDSVEISEDAISEHMFSHVTDDVELTSKTLELISKTLDTLALELISKHNIAQVGTGAKSGISKVIGKNLSQHVALSPIDYNGYRDSYTQHILAAKEAPYILYKLPAASEQINAFLQKIASDCTDRKSLADLPYVKDFVLFYVLNEDDPKIKIFMDAFTKKYADVAPLIAISIEKTKALQAFFLLPKDEFIKGETFEQIKELTKEASIQTVSAEGQSLLGHASELGCVDMVEYLVDQGANIEYKDSFGKTALSEVCSCNKKDEAFAMAETLLKKNAKVNSKNAYNQTPLIIAIRNNLNEEFVNLLYENGAEINISDEYNTELLLTACFNDNLNLPLYLIERGTEIKSDKCRNELLLASCRQGNLKFVQYLIENKADVNSIGSSQNTPLLLAFEAGNLNLVRYLLEQNANINVRDENKNTPLLLACKMGNLNLVQYLIREKQADIDVCDCDGNTPLLLACEIGNLDLVQYLIGQKVNMNVCNGVGKKPLQVAFHKGDVNLVQYLIEQGADIDAVPFNPLKINKYLWGFRSLADEKFDVFHKQLLSRIIVNNKIDLCNEDNFKKTYRGNSKFIVEFLEELRSNQLLAKKESSAASAVIQHQFREFSVKTKDAVERYRRLIAAGTTETETLRQKIEEHFMPEANDNAEDRARLAKDKEDLLQLLNQKPTIIIHHRQ